MRNKIKWPLYGVLSKVDVVLLSISIVLSLWIHPNAGLILLTLSWMFFIYEQRGVLASFMGNISMGGRHYAKAVKWYETAAKTTNAKVLYIKRYVVIGIKHSTIEEVEKTFNRIIKLRNFKEEDDIKEIELIKALILWKKGEVKEAINVLEVLQEKMEDENVRATLAFLKVIERKDDEYLNFTKESYDKYPKNIIIRSLYAISLYLTNKNEEAREIFERLTEGFTNIPDTYYYYADLLEKEGKIEKSLEMLTKGARVITQTIISTVTEEDFEEKIRRLEGEEKIEDNKDIDSLDDLDDIE